MTSGQIFLTLIIALILAQTLVVFRKKRFTKLFMMFWLGIWAVALTVVLWPNLLSSIADQLGIGRGADVAIYLSIILIFFVLFRFYARNNEMETQITQLAREITLLEEKLKKNEKKNGRKK